MYFMIIEKVFDLGSQGFGRDITVYVEDYKYEGRKWDRKGNYQLGLSLRKESNLEANILHQQRYYRQNGP